MLACGMSPRGVMAELTGRRGGYSKGKGGSMHMFSKEKNFYGGHGIVGAQVSLGTGLAFANRYRGNGRMSRWPISATAPPTRARSTKASTWRRCGKKKKKKAAGHLRHREQPLRDGHLASPCLGRDGFLARAAFPSRFPACRSTVWTCAPSRMPASSPPNWCRSGKGPIILEMQTYRYRGHSMSDPAKYRRQGRSAEDALRARPDRAGQGAHPRTTDGPPRRTLKAIDKEIRDIVADAAEFAQADPEPDDIRALDRHLCPG